MFDHRNSRVATVLARIFFAIFPVRVMNYHVHRVRCFVRRAAEAVPAGSRVLDAGAGDLQYKPAFAHCRYVGMDYRPTPGLDLTGDVSVLPFAPGSFDALLCFQVLEHVPRPRDFFAEAYRCLVPGGQLFLSTHHAFPKHMEPWDYWRFTDHGLAMLATEAGFVVESLEPQGGIFVVLAKMLQLSVPELLHGRTALILLWYLLACAPLFLANCLCLALDRFDRVKSITLNYECIFRKDG